MRIKELITKLKSFWLSKKILLVSAKCFNLVVSNSSQSSPPFCVDQFIASTFPPSSPPPLLPRQPPGIWTFWRWVLSNCHTRDQNCVQMLRATAGFDGLFFSFFFFFTWGRISNRDFLVNLFFWAICTQKDQRTFLFSCKLLFCGLVY